MFIRKYEYLNLDDDVKYDVKKPDNERMAFIAVRGDFCVISWLSTSGSI